jgi:integrase
MAKRRRDKGDGSITRRKDGTYQGYVSIGYNDNGTPKRRHVYGKTKQEVRAKVEQLRHQILSHTFVNTDVSLQAYLEQWLKTKERQLKPQTTEDYRYTYEKYLLPKITKIQLGKINVFQIESILGEIKDNHGARTSNASRSLLYSALRQAVKQKVLPHNPMEGVSRVREEKRQMTLWTLEQINKLFEASEHHRLFPLFYLAMATCMRIGELLGLQWHDIQEDRIFVRRSLGQHQNLSTPKTERSQRIVTIATDALQLLAKHKERQQGEYKYLEEPWSEKGHVFVSELATVLDHRNVLRAWHKLQDDAGVPRARLHDLRHMHVSLLVKKGLDARTIADRVGHTNPAFTMKQYSHSFEEQRRAAAISLTDLLASKQDSKEETKKTKKSKRKKPEQK